MRLRDRLWYLTRPIAWRWRLGYWDRDANRHALRCAVRGNRELRDLAKACGSFNHHPTEKGGGDE